MDVLPGEDLVLCGCSDGGDPSLYLWSAGTGGLLKKNGRIGGVSSPVNAAAFSPEGRRIVTGGDSGSFSVWDLRKACRDISFRGHTKGVTEVSFSRDGRRIVSGSRDKTVKLWDAEAGKLLKTFTGYEDFVMAVSFSPDGRKVFSADRDNVIKVWDAESGRLLKTIRGEEKEVSLACFSPNGRLALSGGRDGTVRLWDSHTGGELGILSRHAKMVNSVVFSSDIRFVLSAGDDAKAIMYDLHTSKYMVLVSSKDQKDWLIYTDDGFWDSSVKGGELAAVVRELDCWNVDLFAVRNNRPDLILQSLPDPDRKLIDHYYAQYRRRLRRLGMSEGRAAGEYHVPKAEVDSSSRQGKYIDLTLIFEDPKIDLKSYNIYVNDVPLFGAYGKKITGRHAEIVERIELTAGAEQNRSVLHECRRGGVVSFCRVCPE